MLQHRRRCRSVSVPNSLHSAREDCDVEVHEQTERFVCVPQIREHLSMVNRQNRFNRFQLHDHRVFHDDVDSIPPLQLETFVMNGNYLFSHDVHPTLTQFIHQAGPIRALEKTRPKCAMDFNPSADDAVGEVIQVVRVHAVVELQLAGRAYLAESGTFGPNE